MELLKGFFKLITELLGMLGIGMSNLMGRVIILSLRVPRPLDGVSFYLLVAFGEMWLKIAATLSYDRLGVGRSSHPDGIQTVQINYEIAQSIGIAQALRNGYLSDLGKFTTVVGVGHSYGSNLLTGAAAMEAGNVFDALILTGFTDNSTMG